MSQKLHQINRQRKNFRGQNLAGADFSHIDIRGSDFRNAVLIGANFHHAKAGLPTLQRLCLTALSWLLSFFAGLTSAYSGALIGDLLINPNFGSSLFGFISGTALIIFLTVILWKGFGIAFATLAEVAAACLISALAFFPDNQPGLLIGTLFTAMALTGVIAGVGNMAIAIGVGNALPIPALRVLAGCIAIVGAILGALLGVREPVAFIFAGLVPLLIIPYSIYLGQQAISGNSKFKLIRSLSIYLVSRSGSCFQGADLTDVDFTQAILANTDFRQANLTRTCWFQAQKLSQACVEGTYLEDFRVQQLVVTKDGREQSFNRFDLQGLNLKDAVLQDVSFIGANLSAATLQNANLTGAKLAQAQLYKADLTNACLTGAYIENWGISTDTQLEGIVCDYIYTKLPTKEDPDPSRKPDKRGESFKSGEFSDFITPIIKVLDLYKTQDADPRQIGRKFKTLDLFHYEGIDPTAAAIAVTQLAEEHPEAKLEVISLEGRGQEKIRLQAIVDGQANRSELYTEYFAKYAEIQSLPYSDIQALLAGIAEKDQRIRSLEKLLENALQQPTFYVETQHNRGEMVMSQSQGNVSISGVQGNVSGVAAAGENQTMTGVAIGAISGSVTNTINQLPASQDPDNPGIKELLAQLQAEIEAESELPDEDKAEALEQIKTLAEAGQKPEDNALQKSAKTAMKILKGTVANLPDAAKLAEACAKLLPIISGLLLLG